MASITDGFSYDVFLSFRGKDTRYCFTGNLWKALHDRGIRTFMDDEELRKGDEIAPSLVKAIEQSRMAIIVLSKNYASSSFCLQELSNILDCIKDKGRSVLPVFYDVDPFDVRRLTGTYGEAMAKHEARSNHNMDSLQKWKNALYQVANVSGFHYTNGDGYEHEFIGKIVEQVSREIKPVTLPVPDYVVGLELKSQELVSLLNVGSDDRVHMVGIHGVGGIGKTTLALAVYNMIVHQFEGSCFLENVRENSDKHGLPYLQKLLLSQIVGDENIELTGFKQGISILQQRLRQKKVLLILDDVDKQEQLHAIAGKPDWFGPGSRVIITTRNTRLLTCHGVESTYEVKELKEGDAFELLTRTAFKTDKVSAGYAGISNSEVTYFELLSRIAYETDEVSAPLVDILHRVITYASGLPLALEVVGSHLFNKTIDEWKSVLDGYERIPNKEIQTILKVSFDALEEEEKNVFLDIACCFKGRELEWVKRMLHAHHGDSKEDHIRVLVENSLIKISESHTVTLHDLIEDVGKEIVRQESPGEPGKRSRLWFPEDVVQVLEGNTGTTKIEIIYLDSPVKVECDRKAFKKMKNLRTLIMKDAQFSESPKHLPNSLRIFQCWLSPSWVLPSDFYPKKLAICNIPYDFALCKWGDFFKKKFEKMTTLYFQHCSLTQIPDISGLLNLKELSIKDCGNLITIDDSMGLLGKLEILCIINCIELMSIPPLKLPSLKELDLSRCGSLENFPHVVGGFLDKLKFLSVEDCFKLKSIPPLKLASLKELYLSNCWSLESFPPVVDGLLDKLKILDATGCSKFRSIPPLKLPSLIQLNLSKCRSLESFPPLVDGFLDELKILSVKRCNKLRSIPPLKLALLEELDLTGCDSLESLPPMVGLLDKLKILSVKGCSKLRNIPPLNLASLEQLDLSYCVSLEGFPEILGQVERIAQLYLHRTPIKELPFSFQNLTLLRSLYLSDCGIVQFPNSIVMMLELTEITIKNGGWLFPKQDESEGKMSPKQSSEVEILRLWNCNLSEEYLAIGLEWFANVKELDLSLSKFTVLPECIGKCHVLWKLILNDCEELEEIKGIPPSLKTLSAYNCISLTSSCKSKLLNQELHEAGNTRFCLPHTEIPEWFDHQCKRESSISFWFRNEFPAIALCFVYPLRSKHPFLWVIVNGCRVSKWDDENKYHNGPLKAFHLQLFHKTFVDQLDKKLLKNKWNHVKVKSGFGCEIIGVHVLKEKSGNKDILFSNELAYSLKRN
uniref:ADP-ribosyl cyclase/cyclic ADP-ribose hydrolase n=2 Tax=Caragana korshinskii TaxID=220689 RepID=A0A0R7K407_9FABA|nr:disease resistance protein [Caragana korshinskii]